MAEKYKCNKCGATFDEPMKMTATDKTGGAPTTVKETEQQCCPACGAPQDEFAGDTHKDSMGRWD